LATSTSNLLHGRAWWLAASNLGLPTRSAQGLAWLVILLSQMALKTQVTARSRHRERSGAELPQSVSPSGVRDISSEGASIPQTLVVCSGPSKTLALTFSGALESPAESEACCLETAEDAPATPARSTSRSASRVVCGPCGQVYTEHVCCFRDGNGCEVKPYVYERALA
jgi:hypothetical protein